MLIYPTTHRAAGRRIAERLSAVADLGFWPIPEAVTPLIASFIAPAPSGTRVFDPCAGEGLALSMLGDLLGIPRSQRYANELHDTRAAACTAHASHVCTCDALKALQSVRNMFQLGYLNPPFGNDGAEEGGGRLEPKFFRRFLEEYPLVQPGGVAIYVTPQDIFARPEVAKHLARCFDDITLVAHPPEHRQFREATMLGVVRALPRSYTETTREVQRLMTLLAGELPIITAQPEPRYRLPEPLRVRKLVWRDASRGTPALAQSDVIRSGGAWRSKSYLAAAAPDRRQLQPAFPLHTPQAVLRIAAGAINGMTVTIDGAPMTIKGSTRVETLESSESFTDNGKDVTETRRIERRVPHIVAVDDAGSVVAYQGDRGLQELMNQTGTADGLLAAVEQSAPPRYRMDLAPDVAGVLAALRPVSGRHLPGYAPGLLPMQQHAVAAAHRALTTPDPGWGGAVPSATIIAAEMGTGKTSMGIALAEVLRVLAPTNR
jgi:hypothetical protein